jgi:hypothetical protein
MTLQKLHHFIRDVIDRFTLTVREFPDEVFRQQWDILYTLPQRRDSDWEDIEAIIQIRTKFFLLNQLPQILIRGGDHPHIDRNYAAASQPLDLLFLEDAQEFGLEFEREISDFIEKQRSSVGSLKAPHGLCNGTGKSAALMSEKFTFEQCTRNRRAINRHEAVLPAWAGVVNPLCDDFFAAARFALNQNAAIG